MPKTIVESASDDGENSCAGKPPRVPKGLLFLGIKTADCCYKAGWNDAFNKTLILLDKKIVILIGRMLT